MSFEKSFIFYLSRLGRVQLFHWKQQLNQMMGKLKIFHFKLTSIEINTDHVNFFHVLYTTQKEPNL